MTGFGKAICELENKKVRIVIKTLNSKQLDIIVKIPNLYKEKELFLRNEIAKQIKRGNVELIIFLEFLKNEKISKINPAIIKNYYEHLNNIAHDLNIKLPEQILSSIIRLPDALTLEAEELDEEEWEQIYESFKRAIDELNAFRTQEGAAIEKDIITRIQFIEKYLSEIHKFEKKRIENIKNRINQGLNKLILGKEKHLNKETIDQNRFEQELIYYIEKIDFTEEKVRLKNHCNYFLENIKDKGPIGKKLGFISQEIGREINTIGAKANDSDIQKLVVQMKDELEKIKEQLMNVL